MVEPFTDILKALKASLSWAQKFIDQDWEDWNSDDPYLIFCYNKYALQIYPCDCVLKPDFNPKHVGHPANHKISLENNVKLHYSSSSCTDFLFVENPLKVGGQPCNGF
uniref:Uncharacterized protein n=1 Tax=Rhizophora mucronata TaxID=61149 RepID=A0A2P2MBQ5_RHIMU